MNTENLELKDTEENKPTAFLQNIAVTEAEDEAFEELTKKQTAEAKAEVDDEVFNNDALFDDADGEDFFAKASGSSDPLFDDEDALPAFDFSLPQTITLKDGSEFKFKIPDLQSETRADNLRKTLIITSPAKVNGFNPTQETTDYATADMRYFIDNCEQFRGLAFNRGDDPTVWTDAKRVIRHEKRGTKTRAITAAHIFPVKWARAATARLYGGKIEVEKAEGKEKEIKVVNEARFITVKQEFGVEQNDDGSFTRPTNIVRYKFREPVAGDLTFWQTKCFLGSKIPLKGGGSREERFFNTEKVAELFDMLIESVSGGALGEVTFDPKNSEHLKKLPVGIKRTAVAICMGEVSGDVGNS